jgi:hypothetical protein
MRASFLARNKKVGVIAITILRRDRAQQQLRSSSFISILEDEEKGRGIMYSRLWVINREEVTGLPHHSPVSTLGERKKNTRQRMCTPGCCPSPRDKEKEPSRYTIFTSRTHTCTSLKSV